jgi:hypothetical protein
MGFEEATALIIIGTVYMMFKFAESINVEEEWSQPLKLLVNMIGMFILLAGVGWMIQLQRTTAGVDTTLIDIASAILIALGFVVVPTFSLFLLIFLKHILEFIQKLKSGPDFTKD